MPSYQPLPDANEALNIIGTGRIRPTWYRFFADLLRRPFHSASATDGIGYTTGAGGSQTQLTSKATTVVLSKAAGQITLHNATLNAATTVSFTLTNTTLAAGDVLVLNHISGGTAGAYTLNAQCANGSASINVRNVTAGNLGEAIVIAFARIKAVTS